jgi:hypothetical protein
MSSTSNPGPDNRGGPKTVQSGPDNRGGPKIVQTPPLVLNSVKKSGGNPIMKVTIKNPNNVSLAWNPLLENESSPGGWLNLGQTVSPIPAGASVTLAVTVNTARLTPGQTYTATLVANSNSGSDQAPISVTVVN